MPDEFKNHATQNFEVYIGKKLVSIGPRGTISLTDKDIETSPQIQQLMNYNFLRKLPKTKARSSAAAAKPESESKGDTKKKD